MNFDEYFIEFAKTAALKSKDRSTKVGSVIVTPDNELISTGYNSFCRGFNDGIESRHDRPAKYIYTEHSERNSIYNAARIGVSTKGCTMYQNFSPTSCVDCARAIIQSGIAQVVGPPVPFTGKRDWQAEIDQGIVMMLEAGVHLWVYDGERRVALSDWLRLQ
jgi:dCMP deaminase